MRLLLIALVSLLSLLFHLSLSDFVPSLWPDEVLFFNPAWEWWRSGVMRTSVLDGLIPGMESYTLWMPPLYILGLGSLFHIIQPSISVARMFSSFWGVSASVLVVMYFTKANPTREKSSWNKFVFLVPLIFILTDILFINVSHTSRMETLCAFLGIASLILARKDLFFWGGLFLGGSFLSHPFAVFYGLPFLYWVISKSFHDKSLLPTLKSVIGGIIPITLWMFYVIPQFDLFLVQFGAQLERKRELLGHFGFLDRFRIWVHFYPLSILKLILIMMTFIWSLKGLDHSVYRKEISFALFWYVSMFLGFYLSTESWYAIHMIFPGAILVYYIVLVSYSEKGTFFLSKIFFLILVVYQVASILWFQYSHLYKENAHAKTKEFFSKVDEITLPHNNIYIQLIPDPYFHLKERYPHKKLWEFIPGELPIPPENLSEMWQKMDLFLFYNDNLMNPSLKKFLLNNPDYHKAIQTVVYDSKVPTKGPWKIISYSRITKNIESTSDR